MKKLSIFLTLAMLICMLTACESTKESTKESIKESTEESTKENTEESTKENIEESTKENIEESTKENTEESTQTDILYAVFYGDDVKEYPIEYTGAQKTAEELAHELSKLTGLDFNITASKADDGWSVDWAADSTLIAGIDGREQKEEFHFFDNDSLCWFMMDSLWRTLTENLNAENIYYTMDGGKALVLDNMSPVFDSLSDTPYMGSDFYLAHSDVRGDDETPTDTQAAYQGFWEYPDGTILEINGEEWNLYADDGLTLLAGGPMEYMEDAAFLMNDDGSSGGGRLYFDENNNLVDTGNVLTYHGESLF